MRSSNKVGSEAVRITEVIYNKAVLGNDVDGLEETEHKVAVGKCPIYYNGTSYNVTTPCVVNLIVEHKPKVSGDKLHYLAYLNDGTILKIFNPNLVTMKE